MKARRSVTDRPQPSPCRFCLHSSKRSRTSSIVRAQLCYALSFLLTGITGGKNDTCYVRQNSCRPPESSLLICECRSAVPAAAPPLALDPSQCPCAAVNRFYRADGRLLRSAAAKTDKPERER